MRQASHDLLCWPVLSDRRRGAARLEAFDDHLLERRRQQPLDVVQQRALGGGDQRDGASGQPGASGASDAVDVVVGDERQVVS